MSDKCAKCETNFNWQIQVITCFMWQETCLIHCANIDSMRVKDILTAISEDLFCEYPRDNLLPQSYRNTTGNVPIPIRESFTKVMPSLQKLETRIPTTVNLASIRHSVIDDTRGSISTDEEGEGERMSWEMTWETGQVQTNQIRRET